MFKTVKSKVALTYISLVIVIVLLGAISLLNMTQISITINGLISTNYNSVIRLSDMRDRLLELDKAAYAYVFGGEEGASDAFYACAEQFWETYSAEYETIVIPQEQQYIDAIGEAFRIYMSLFDEISRLNPDSARELQTARTMYENDLRAQQARVETEIRNLFASNEAALFDRQEQAAKNARDSILMLGVIFPAAALAGYWLSTLYAKRFFSPLYEITQSVRRVREGNLDSRTTVSTEDEFGMLADEFNNMTRRLQEFERNAMGSLLSERSKSDSIIKSINEPLLIVDKNGDIAVMNKAFAELFGLQAEAAEGQPLRECLSHDDLIEYAEEFHGPAEGRHPSKAKTITVRQKEEDLFFHIVGTPIPGPEREPSGMLLVLHNITEMKLLEKTRGDFIATISHEFKTPLTSIVMGVDLMTNEQLGSLSAEQREIVETIREDSRRLEVLVGEMLELSKIESSKAFYDFSLCDIREIITASAKQFLSAAERNSVNMTTRFEENLPRVNADFSKITWVLNNLLSNAMKYTAPGDRIEISAGLSGGDIVVSVADTGIGVPPEFVEQIFEKYGQIKSYDIEIRGSGVGLAVSKEIITAHGGRIWCESKVAEGSTFSFALCAAGDTE